MLSFRVTIPRTAALALLTVLACQGAAQCQVIDHDAPHHRGHVGEVAHSDACSLARQIGQIEADLHPTGLEARALVFACFVLTLGELFLWIAGGVALVLPVPVQIA
jgi:hypothetical protein